jgi:hypothetical protein
MFIVFYTLKSYILPEVVINLDGLTNEYEILIPKELGAGFISLFLIFASKGVISLKLKKKYIFMRIT